MPERNSITLYQIERCFKRRYERIDSNHHVDQCVALFNSIHVYRFDVVIDRRRQSHRNTKRNTKCIEMQERHKK